MKTDPCKKEYEEYLKAAREWEITVNECRRFLVLEPLDPINEPRVFSPQETEEMFQAYEKEKEAAKISRKATAAWLECLHKHTR